MGKGCFDVHQIQCSHYPDIQQKDHKQLSSLRKIFLFMSCYFYVIAIMVQLKVTETEHIYILHHLLLYVTCEAENS